jgi:fumarate reductase flavoprotein subunit
LKAGAATEGLGTVHTSGMYFPDTTGRVLSQQPNTVWVNNRGERYIDEGVCYNHFVTANAIVRQPGSMSYTLLDDALIQHFAETGFIKGVNRVISQMIAMKSAVPGLPIPNLKEIMQVSADKGDAKISDSWYEIASWMGAEPEALKAEIDHYNSYCDKGHDEIFAKERRYLVPLRTPPYYALKCGFAFPETLGGLKINHHMEVVDKEDYPIPGLYAAGVDTGGWEPHTFNLNLTGSPLGFSVSGGRIAAESVVKYLSHTPTN